MEDTGSIGVKTSSRPISGGSAALVAEQPQIISVNGNEAEKLNTHRSEGGIVAGSHGHALTLHPV